MAKRNQVAKPVVRYALLIALTIWTLGPVTWLVSLAFKPPLEWYTSNLIPREPIIDNFIWIFNTTNPIGKTSVMTAVAEPVMKPFLNSIVVSSLGTVFAVLVGFLAAYGVSRYRAGGTFTLFFTLLTRMLPGAVFITPLLIYYSTLRILDTHFGLIVLYTAVTLTYSIWILKGFIDEIPPEYEEAALLEGASPWSI
ncbi:MAG: carbohydrate ABC transporter permease, partial [Candidatus Bathyarchaeia archaeon]